MLTQQELNLNTASASDSYDAIVIGSGPNGLAAAIELARNDRSVLVVEGAEQLGGGTRTLELTAPGFHHDVCSAVHPLGVASPFFKSLPLEEHGLEWIYPEASVVHAFKPDQPVVMYPDMDRTVAGLGQDADAYRRLVEPFVNRCDDLLAGALAPFRLIPHHPLLMARFGWHGMRSITRLAKRHFQAPETAGLFAGLAAHSILPLEQSFTSAVGLMFAVMGHMVSWPIARGGSGQISLAMAKYLQSLGGEIIVGRMVTTLSDLPPARAFLFDTIPANIIPIVGDRFPAPYVHKLRKFRHGPGVFKIDWALDGPVPWRHPEYATAATVHIGGTIEEIADAERAAWEQRVPEKPFVLYAQQSQFDATRAPMGQHTGWGYCHVPPGSTVDYTEMIESRIEEFAPGFGKRIIERKVHTPQQMAAHNVNYVGGDITGGVMDIWQTFARPVSIFAPYRTAAEDIFICSSSTPPGPGVHGQCGFFAAQAALHSVLSERTRERI